MSETSDYILVTPVKNEEEVLEKCIDSVSSQKKLPLLWVIVDDGSDDNTPGIIERAKDKFQWIRTVRLQSGERDLGVHYSHVCIEGFKSAAEICDKENLNYYYIGLLDADIVLPANYYEYLVNRMVQTPSLGIISGRTSCLINNELMCPDQTESLPSGAARLWNKKCFDETGGYMHVSSPDSVSNIKAKLSGWSIKRYSEISFIQLRETASAKGLWDGWSSIGRRNRYLGFPISFALFKSLKYSSRSPYYLGIAYFMGYFSFLLRGRQIEDESVRNYYKYTRPKEERDKRCGKIKNRISGKNHN